MGFLRTALLVLAGFVLYWNTLPAPFTFDDERAIVVNEQIRHISTAFSPTERGSPLAGRPLVSLSFALNYAAGGLNVTGYRVVNIALHITCALLLFLCVRQALIDLDHRTRATGRARSASAGAGPTAFAFAAAMLWMVHPLVTEAVNYVSQRTELMMASLFMLTLYLAQRAASAHAPGTWRALSITTCALGMACKETMAVAPVAVFLYEGTIVFGSLREALQKHWRFYAGLCATWLILIVLQQSSPRGDSAGFAGASVSPWEYLLNQSVMIVRYLRLAVWPRGLVLDYGEPLHLTLSQTAPDIAFVVVLIVATLMALARWPALGFLGAWFFLTLAPTSSVIPISTEVGAERRMYLPLMGLVVLALALVARSLTIRHPLKQSARGIPYQRTIYAGTLGVALVLGAATVQRNAEYLSGLTLWQTVLDRWPPHARAHRNLAAELKLAGRREEEIDHLRAAVTDLPEIRNLLGAELLSLGRVDEGIAELRRFVRERPTDVTVADAQAAVASALMTREDYEGARVEYAELLRTRPRDADAWSNLGIALSALHRMPEATSAFERAVEIDPGNGLSQRNLALHLLDQNDFDGAVAHARAALRLTPNDAAAHSLLGLALAGQQKLDEAVAEFRASLTLQPADNDASGYLERTLRLLGR